MRLFYLIQIVCYFVDAKLYWISVVMFSLSL